MGGLKGPGCLAGHNFVRDRDHAIHRLTLRRWARRARTTGRSAGRTGPLRRWHSWRRWPPGCSERHVHGCARVCVSASIFANYPSHRPVRSITHAHRGALQHCGLRDAIGQLLGKAEPLRNARADDYSKGWKHANHLRRMAQALSEVG